MSLKPLPRRGTCPLVLLFLLVMSTAAWAGVVRVTLEAPELEIQPATHGLRVTAVGYGATSTPGVPQLPQHTFLVALPPGAEVRHVELTPGRPERLPGEHRVRPVQPIGNGGGAAEFASAREFDANRAAIYGSNERFPAAAAEYLGQGRWRGVTYARVRFRPAAYRPLSGDLERYPRLDVTIEYDEGLGFEDPALVELRDDHVLDDIMARHLVNFEESRDWYGRAESVEPKATHYDYVVIAANDSVKNRLTQFTSWKAQLGFNVRAVTLDWIFQNYTASDSTNTIRDFLVDKYGEWGIRYVLLIGNLTSIPAPRLSSSSKHWAMRSDHFYALLSDDWNKDGDLRWGEMGDDQLDPIADVLVGRIPWADPDVVQGILAETIEFESRTGAPKRDALLVGGLMDIQTVTQHTDAAEPLELIRNEILGPEGWSSRSFYEKTGLSPSAHSADGTCSRANTVAEWSSRDYGLVVLADHGSPGSMTGRVWNLDADADQKADDGEQSWNDIIGIGDFGPSNPFESSVVLALGCETGMIAEKSKQADGTEWPQEWEGPAVTPRAYKDNFSRQALRHRSAAGVVSFTSVVPYGKGWSGYGDAWVQSMGYLLADGLVANQMDLGSAVVDAKIRYKNDFFVYGQYNSLYWAMHVYGDPSLMLQGYDLPVAANTLVHSGIIYASGGDNAENGDLYVAVSTFPEAENGHVDIRRSTDHGQSWTTWKSYDHGRGIRDLDLVVSEWGSGEFVDDAVIVVLADTASELRCLRFPLDGEPAESVTILSPDTAWERDDVQVVRDTGVSNYPVYVAWSGYSDAVTSWNTGFARSLNNGLTWEDFHFQLDSEQARLATGPDGVVHRVVRRLKTAADAIEVNRSTDYGETWSTTWTDLTAGDGDLVHWNPTVGASTDPGYPVVWVSYEILGAEKDVRFATSTDAGLTWAAGDRGQTLAGQLGTWETHPTIEGYRDGVSRWVNAAYLQESAAGWSVFWRYSSGAAPDYWSAPRRVNDVAAALSAPELLYSPGSSASGSGVLYGGSGSPPNGLYYAAPWLSPSSAVEPSLTSTSDDPGPTTAGKVFAGVEDVTAMDHLLRSDTGSVMATGTVTDGEGHRWVEGFRSDDGGVEWTPLGPIGDLWTAHGLSEAGGLLFASGMAEISGEGRARIFYSEDGGGTWLPTGALPAAVMVFGVGPSETHDLAANVGPDPLVLVGSDPGGDWAFHEQLPVPFASDQLPLLALPDGSALVAATTPARQVVLLRSAANLSDWYAMALPVPVPAPARVHCLERTDDGRVWLGGEHEGGPFLLVSEDIGHSWVSALPTPIPGPEAITAVTVSGDGEVVIGVRAKSGTYSSRLLATRDPAEGWNELGPWLYGAEHVNDLLPLAPRRMLAATGDVFGNCFAIHGNLATAVGGTRTPSRPVLGANWPNPFNPSTSIRFSIPENGPVTLRVFSLRGRLVATLVDETLEAGGHVVRWDGRDHANQRVSSGVYLYRLSAAGEVHTRKMTLIK